MFARLKSLDDRIFDNIPRIHRPAINRIMVTATRLGNAGIIWWFVCLMFLISPKWRYTGLVIIFSIGLTSLMGEGIIKHAVKRVRPCHDLDEEDKLLNNPRTFYSFPSGHTASSFAVAMVVILSHCPVYVMLPILMIASLIGFSRVYLRVHYLTDVVVGLFLGLVCGTASVMLFHAIVPQDLFYVMV
ncbi:MAG: phosphatase PAP2 family protein [Ruminococcus sp.]|nr:phosphatase PAP2 family protein [Ruminococcus sp.]MBQ1381125.1 phosphatase PAP2 family protein [Ruminococcus sp.]MBQ1638275.1 phosphatase PAP2 family protein [Ruminococcus sp.]MBQ1807219.1 phosphatase PAP2 family protein [Ruminococcus sp.]MBQ1975697.1 phosphatase PAP2 family protein [Ruminococcus sp.]